MPTDPVHIIIADDHPAIVMGVQHELQKTKSFEIVGRVKNSTELFKALEQHECEVLISDYAMPGGKHGDGIALFSLLRRHYPTMRLVVLTMMNNPALTRELVRLGINCILSKSDPLEHISAATLAAVHHEQYFSPAIKDQLISQSLYATKTLTAREAEIVRLFGTGLTISEIARQWNRSVQTISTQKSSAMRKLGIKRDSDLLRYANDWERREG